MRVTTFGRFLGCIAIVAMTLTEVQAGPISVGNLVVVQVGTGAAPLAGTGTAAFLQEFTTTGASVQTINLPTAAAGPQLALTLSGTSTSEGFIDQSSSGQYLTLGGYNVAPGGVTAGAANNRVAGRVVIATGALDTSTNLQDAANGNIRSVTSQDGSQFWAGTSAGGVRYTTFGTVGASTQINSAAPTNTRVVDIFTGPQLYMGSASGTYLGIGTVGSGLPTTSGQTPTLLTGFPTTGTHSSYDFWFKDANTLYVADDGTAANGGGIQKWTLTAGVWSLQYTLLNTGAATTGVRGLTGTIGAGGNAVLFATTSATTNTLITVTDTGAAAAATVLATAPTNTAFRGVQYINVPEPASIALMGLAGLLFAGLLRRRS